jgi:hypothetical protein
MAGTLRLRDTFTRVADHGADLDVAGPRPGTIAAGLVAVVILLGAGAVALSGGGNSPSARPTAGPVASTPATPPAAAPAAGVNPEATAATADEGPLLTAPKVDWQLFAGVPLPYSKIAGPTRVEGPVYSGYERSQTGALIAAVQLGNRYLLTPGDGWREVLERQVLPGTGRDVFARGRATVEADDPPGTYGQPAGFRFVAFTPDVASIQLVTRFPMTGNLQVVTVTVKWAASDWRLELQPDGGSSPTAQAVADLDGFVVWGI